MSNVIHLPVIAGVEITTDDSGRFNLNALHKAHLEMNPDLHRNSKQPADWLKLEGTKDLIEAISNSEDLGICPVESKAGRYGGSFAHELLAVSYAGWISPAFQLQVNQTFIDYRTGKLQQPALPQSLPEALRYAAELAEANQAMKPKVEALDRIATSDGSLCITNTAKDLQMRPKDLFRWLHANRWIYRRPGGQGWIAYQDRLQRGDLEHKVTTVSRSDGSEKTVEQVRVTPKGLARLAEHLKPMEDIA